MQVKTLREIIRLYILEVSKKKKDLLTEPQKHEEQEDEQKNEFSAGGVAGAPSVRRKKPNYK